MMGLDLRAIKALAERRDRMLDARGMAEAHAAIRAATGIDSTRREPLAA